ncbi:MAG: archaeosortase/exosortase family protein [Acidimicrobiales bacterium]
MTAAQHPSGSIVVLGGAPDDATTDAVGADDRRSVIARGLLLAAVTVAAYGPTLADSVRGLGTSSPLAFAGLAPLTALIVGAAAVRRAPVGPARLARRSAERIVAAALFLAAVAVAWLVPANVGFGAGPGRALLASLPFFVGGGLTILFGARAAFWTRHAVLLLLAAAPILYQAALDGLLAVSVEATSAATAGVARGLGVGTSTAADVRLVGIGDQLVAIGSVCAGANSIIGWLVVGGALAVLLDGGLRAKLAWLATGAVLAWLANLARLAAVVAAGRWWGSTVALDGLHPYAGSVAIALAVAAALGLSGRFGLRRKPVVARRTIDRVALVAPARWGIDACCVSGVALLIAGASLHGERFDRLGGRNGAVNSSASEALAATELTALQTIPLGSVPWSAQYFGAGSSWERYVLLEQAPAAGTLAASVGVDVTTVLDESSLETFGLAECYGFHGWQLSTEQVSGRLTERPAEVLRYHDGTAGTLVVSWRQRVPGGIERVVVSGRYGTGGNAAAHQADERAAEAGPERLPDEATVARLVWDAAAELADATYEGGAVGSGGAG